MMKKTILVLALAGTAAGVHAQDKVTDDQLCEKAVKYSVKYIPEEDDAILHQARWKIIEGDRTDDIQKLISLVVFEWGQRIGYSYDAEVHGDGSTWIEEQIRNMADACEQGVREARGTPYGDFESANPDEAW